MKIKKKLFKIAEDVLRDIQCDIDIIFFEDKEKKESGIVSETETGFLITIPDWVLNMNENYSIWYMIHECTHCLIPRLKHTKEFKRLESAFCLKYGIKLKYSKVYPKALYDLNDNFICLT